MASTGYFSDNDAYQPVAYQGDDMQEAAPPHSGGGMAAVANWAAAIVSLGLVLGMGIWAVQLTVRDVSGVPVIEALEGPMREPPADPGGTQAPHQGLAVNRIAEGAEAQPVPDRLVIAPPPLELREISAVAPAAPTEVADGTNVALNDSLGTEAIAPELALEPGTDATEADTAALIDRLLLEAQSADAPATEPGTAAPDGAAVATTEVSDTVAPIPNADRRPLVIPASVPGVANSIRPAIRPLVRVGAQTVAQPLSRADEGVELAVADLADGTRLVQLGAFDTADIARTEWTRLAGQFPDFFAERPRVIEEASSGGQAFYRLRAAGFDDLAGARRFCAVLVAQGAACIPVTVR